MSTDAIIASIDKELARLHEVRRLITQNGNKLTSKSPAFSGTRPRLSAAARARIAEAQRKRWAAVRKEAKG